MKLSFGVSSFSDENNGHLDYYEVSRTDNDGIIQWKCTCPHNTYRDLFCQHIHKARRQFSTAKVLDGITNQICYDELFIFVPIPNIISLILSWEIIGEILIWKVGVPFPIQKAESFMNFINATRDDLLYLGIPKKVVKEYLEHLPRWRKIHE